MTQRMTLLLLLQRWLLWALLLVATSSNMASTTSWLTLVATL